MARRLSEEVATAAIAQALTKISPTRKDPLSSADEFILKQLEKDIAEMAEKVRFALLLPETILSVRPVDDVLTNAE